MTREEKFWVSSIWILNLTVSEASGSDRVKVRAGVLSSVHEESTRFDGPNEAGKSGSWFQSQPVLLPESTTSVRRKAEIMVELMLFESLTSR